MLSAKCTISLKYSLCRSVSLMFLSIPLPVFTGSGHLVFSLAMLSPLLASCALSLCSASVEGDRDRAIVSSTATDSRWFLGDSWGKEEFPLCELPLWDSLNQIKWFWSTDSEWMDPGWPLPCWLDFVCQNLIWVQYWFYIPVFLISGCPTWYLSQCSFRQ